MEFKQFEISSLDNNYEQLSYGKTDDVIKYDLGYAHFKEGITPFDTMDMINVLKVYSKENNNPLVPKFSLIFLKSSDLDDPMSYFSELQDELCSLNDIIEGIMKAVLPEGFDIFQCGNLICKPQKKKNNARKRTNIPRGLRHEVFKRDNYTCVECGASKKDGATLHVDHIIPSVKGGTDEMDNLQTLCQDCNLNKNDVYQIVKES